MEQTVYLQPLEPAEKAEKKPDTEYTKSMKRQFPLFGISSLLYSAFYAFCLYKNASGITYPFFVIGTLCYFFFSMRKLGVPYKKDSIFYIVSVVLLGISNCMTASPQILYMNKCGIFLLTFTLMLHTVYNDKAWNLPKYFAAIFQTIGSCLACLFSPFGDMVSYFDAQKQEKPSKKSYFPAILIGIAIAIPLLVFMTMLLASADVVFGKILVSLTKALNIWTITGILFLMTVVFFSSYGIFTALCKKSVREEPRERTLLDPIIAVVITSLLCVLYVFFSVIQILYLFIGNMELPAGYTYAGYAREGFFQLLAVCIINLFIVLTCLYLFRESKVLKGILTVICACTFIMIFSSALRMILYINSYALTFLRLFVLWSLAVIFFLMAGITAAIFWKHFPLFFYGAVTVTICYIVLSFSHPDYLIARYDLSHDGSRDYLCQLSADATPAILNPDINLDFTDIQEALVVSENTAYDDTYYDLYWIRRHYYNIEDLTKNMHFRNFNFSLYKAQKYIE
ncbi:MAG: DUF4173 domain-containing protein [Lachnospiraceae bacterium]|nr:DUF4173 domain-containing protein [Lachnospiraceae bacterium]